jgi:hypothetical protein
LATVSQQRHARTPSTASGKLFMPFAVSIPDDVAAIAAEAKAVTR